MSSRLASERAAEALRLVQTDPGRAAPLARAALAAASSADAEAASVAERALGLAAVHLHDLGTAASHLRAAMIIGRRAGSPQLVAEARMTLAYVLNLRGASRRAVHEIDVALGDLDPAGRARALAQRGAIYQQQGRLEAALHDYRLALPTLRRGQDVVWVQRVLSNRGVLHAFRHQYGLATRDLKEALQLCSEGGLTLQAAFVEENLLLVTRRLGDIPASLQHLSRAESLYRSLGTPSGSVLLERSELLLSMRLFAEAREAAETAVAVLERTHRRLGTSEARILLARTAILDGDPELAVIQANRAMREFRAQGRQEWAALARCGLLIAQWHAPGRIPGVRRLARAAAEADEAGWPGTAAEVRLLAGRHGLGGRDHAAALHALGLVARSRHHGPAARRATGWYATALLRSALHDRHGANRAAARGLTVIQDYRNTIAATDLRASISGLGVDLARVGLRNAVDAGSARQVLTWAERGRARMLTERPPLPPDNPELTQLLAELRATVAEADERRRAGRPVTRQMRTQVALERTIRDASRRTAGAGPPSAGDDIPASTSFPVAELVTALDEAALIEYVEIEGMLHVVSVVAGRVRLRPLGPMEPVRTLIRWLPFALHRLARAATGAGRDEASLALLRHAAHQLDESLFAPLHSVVGERPIVVVPTGILQSMPWSLLPSAAGRPVTVTPSAALWLHGSTRQPNPGHVVVVAGPGLPGAEAEAARVAAIHHVAHPIVGAAATHDAVTGALRGAAIAHLAVHGSVRSDNPLFSALTLADGPLTVYDLERLGRGADTVVIAACDAGRNVVLAGDELLGVGSAFLARDTRQVVASVLPIPDAATAPIMVALHRSLAAGQDVATALATVQGAVDPSDLAAVAASAGFVCVGVCAAKGSSSSGSL